MSPSSPTWRAPCVLGWLALAGCGSAPLAGPDPDPAPPPGAPPVYQFGAKFEPPVGRVVHAQGQWVEYNAKYAALLPPAAQPAAELVFLTLGDTPRPWDPADIAARLAAIDAAGRIPSVDLALRGLQPAPGTQLPDPLYGIDAEVASTTRYDGRLADLVQVARAFAKPIVLRIGGEFNGPWNGYHPYEFPKAFRKIVTLFRQAGVENVAFVWCYEPAAPGDFADVGPDGQAKWYPGAAYVDWFAIDLFAAADVSGPLTRSDGSATAFGRTTAFLDMAVAARRPVMIAESSPAKFDFGTAAQADAAWAEWFAPYFALIAGRPEIKWFHYINYDWTKAGYYAASGWKNNDLAASPALTSRYVQEVTAPRYLHAAERHLLKDWDRYR